MKKILILIGALAVIGGAAAVIAGLEEVGEKPAKLTWNTPEVKSALMSLGYNVYGNKKAENGRYYLSKIVFTNTGEHAVTDFSISYKIENYVDWTEPDLVPRIPAGFSLVRLYYPRLPNTVSKLRNAANTTLYTKIRWKEDGVQREENLSHDLVIRAINEIAYCDLPQDEVQTWYDAFIASGFCVSMVTPNDPVVALYTSEITKQAGGTIAGIAGGKPELERICQNIYDYMTRTGLRYVGDSGVPNSYDNISTLVQTVRLPRDTIINNQGLCIELSLLWCSILEHLGVNAALILIPGHAFVVAYSDAENIPLLDGFAIECTAITPLAVGKDAPVSFPDSVKMATDTFNHFMQAGTMKIHQIRDYEAAGFTPPDLPDVEIAGLQDMLDKRSAPARPATLVAENSPQENPAAAPTPAPAPAPEPYPAPGPAPAPQPAPAGAPIQFQGRYFSAWLPGADWVVQETPDNIVIRSPDGQEAVSFLSGRSFLTIRGLASSILSPGLGGVVNARLMNTQPVSPIANGWLAQTSGFSAVRIRDGTAIQGVITVETSSAFGVHRYNTYIHDAPVDAWQSWAPTLQMIEQRIVRYAGP